jgi:hypothetical protein
LKSVHVRNPRQLQSAPFRASGLSYRGKHRTIIRLTQPESVSWPYVWGCCVGLRGEEAEAMLIDARESEGRFQEKHGFTLAV